MQKPTARERFQPCLLDRLVDIHPEKGRETTSQRAIPISVYRDSVLRDLTWLLNTCCCTEDSPIYDYPEASKSVLNYGMKDLCGVMSSEFGPGELEQHVRSVIRNFEPRIIPGSLLIRIAKASIFEDRSVLSFEIEGELWSTPFPEQFIARSQIDLETGQCKIITSGDRP